MSSFLVGLVTAIYVLIAVEQYWKGNMGMAMAYAGYAFSNFGLLLFIK